MARLDAAIVSRRPRARRGPVALCAALALAGHLLVFGWNAGSLQGTRLHGPSTTTATLLHVSLVAAQPVAPPKNPVSPALAQASVDVPPAVDDAATTSGVAGLEAPVFADGPPEVAYPDALLPERGVQLRAYVSVDADGHVRRVVTALRPADASPAFSDFGERALTENRFAPATASRGHCVQLDFRPGESSAAWSWRPDPTPTRCLTNPASTARLLPMPSRD